MTEKLNVNASIFLSREEEDMDTKNDIKTDERSNEQGMIPDSQRMHDGTILKMEPKSDIPSQQVYLRRDF